MKNARIPQHTQIVNHQINLFLYGKCLDTVIKTVTQLDAFITVTRHELFKLGMPEIEVLEYIHFCLYPWRYACPTADSILKGTVTRLDKIIGNNKQQRKDTWINRDILQTM